MTPADLEKFVLAESAAAWRNLIEQDRERGGSGQLRDTAVSLTRGRTVIAVHADFRDGDRMLSAGFILPEPLPSDEEINGVIAGVWQRCTDGFLLRLHEWLEGKRPPPKLFAADLPITLH